MEGKVLLGIYFHCANERYDLLLSSNSTHLLTGSQTNSNFSDIIYKLTQFI